MKRSEKYSMLNEMAAEDLKGVDFEKDTFDIIASKYISNYNTRVAGKKGKDGEVGKPFSSKSIGPMRTVLAKALKVETKDEKINSIVDAAKKLENITAPSDTKERSKKANLVKKEKTEAEHAASASKIGDLASGAAKVMKESLMDNIRKNSGLISLQEGTGRSPKEAQIASIYGRKEKYIKDFKRFVKEDSDEEKDEQGKEYFTKESFKAVQKQVLLNMASRIEEDLSMKFDKVLVSFKEILEILKSILSKELVESVLQEGKGGKSKTAKCPICGNKYLVKTGYCLSCKKKVASV